MLERSDCFENSMSCVYFLALFLVLELLHASLCTFTVSFTYKDCSLGNCMMFLVTVMASSDLCHVLGFWYPYKNIFSLVGELGIEPFTDWTRSAQYSEEGLEVIGKSNISFLPTYKF